MSDVIRQAKLARCKRIATTVQHWPALPCGCKIKIRSCGCKDVCSCEVEPILCDCDEMAPDKEWAKVLAIEAFLHAADPENYDDPPEGHLLADRYLRLMRMQTRLADGHRPYAAGKDLDHTKVKGGTGAGLTGNGRTAWRGTAGYDWAEDEPWWDDHLEWVMQKQVSEREAKDCPLFFQGHTITEFYSLSGDLQQREIGHAESKERASIQARRLALGRLITQVQQVLATGDKRWKAHLERLIELARRDLEHLRQPEWRRSPNTPKARATRPSRKTSRKKPPVEQNAGTLPLFAETTP